MGWQKISPREISRSLFKYIGRTERREKDKRRMKRRMEDGLKREVWETD